MHHRPPHKLLQSRQLRNTAELEKEGAGDTSKQTKTLTFSTAAAKPFAGLAATPELLEKDDGKKCKERVLRVLDGITRCTHSQES